MQIHYQVGPTGIRSNARFRGPTESEKYTNFIGETVHDMVLLGSLMEENKDSIKSNLEGYFSGVNEPITSSIGSSTVLYRVIGPVFENLDLTLWSKEGGILTRESEKYILGGNVILTTPLNVLEGEVIKITTNVKGLSQNTENLTIGSQNVNQGEGSLLTKETSLGQTEFFEHYIFCQQKETITLYIENKAISNEEKIELTNLSIEYVDVNEYALQPVNTSLKRRINAMEEEVRYIINNL